jgi:hypothetical protein
MVRSLADPRAIGRRTLSCPDDTGVETSGWDPSYLLAGTADVELDMRPIDQADAANATSCRNSSSFGLARKLFDILWTLMRGFVRTDIESIQPPKAFQAEHEGSIRPRERLTG